MITASNIRMLYLNLEMQEAPDPHQLAVQRHLHQQFDGFSLLSR